MNELLCPDRRLNTEEPFIDSNELIVYIVGIDEMYGIVEVGVNGDTIGEG